MKKFIIVAAAVMTIGGMAHVGTAYASEASCEHASKEASYYTTQAATRWAAYHTCKASDWLTGANCGKLERGAKYFEKKAQSWRQTWEKECNK